MKLQLAATSKGKTIAHKGWLLLSIQKEKLAFCAIKN